jgi:beta-glucosidase
VLPYLDYALDAKEGDGRLFPNRFAASACPGRFAKDGPLEAQPQSFFPDIMWWGKGRPEQKRAEIVDGPKSYDVVFVGDSITHRWEYDNPGGNGLPVWEELKKTYTLLDIGYGGDQTQHVIWRLLNGELEGYVTKLFMVMIGTNNRGRPADIAAGVKRIVSILREKHPEAKVLLLPIFPRGKTAQDASRARNEQVNAIISGYADGKDVLWLDFNTKFLEPDGSISKEMMKDYLHPDVKGYEIWRDAVLPVFREVVGK